MAKKKSIYILAFLLIIIVLSVFALSKFIHRRETVKSVYQSIPAFSLPDINGQSVTEKSLQKQTPTLFLFFNSDCELCHEELKQINENREQLQKGQIVFFSTETTEKIQDFLNSIAFQRQFNQFFLVDINEELVKTMEIKGTPTAIIYDRDRKQIKRYNSPVKIETLIKYLSEQP